MTKSESEKETHQQPTIKKDDIEDVTPPLPPDGGWGWAVVFASLVCNIIVDGVCFSFGIFYVEFLEAFGESKAKTAWVGSLVPGMYLGAGPIVSALANKYGCREVTIAGSIMASISFFLSTFSPNINWLIFTYGICGGLGFGLMYLPSIVIVGYYFDKKRALATGLAVCGSGVGTFLFAPLARALIDEFGWKGANWIISGIILNGILCGFIFRPLEATKTKKRAESDPENIDHGTIIAKIIAEKERVRTISTGSLNNTIITTDNKLIKDQETVKQIMLKYENQFPKSIGSSGSIPNLNSTEIPKPNVTTVRANSINEDPDFVTKSQSSLVESPTVDKPINWNLEKVRIGAGGKPSIKRMSSNNPEEASLLQRQLSDGNNSLMKSQESLRKRSKDAARPFNRADIFYSGSITNLPEYISNPNMNSYVASVTSMPDIPEDEDSMQAKCAPFCSVLKNMVDFSLLKSATFVILCVASVLAMTGFFTPFVYITDYTMLQGVPISRATLLLSVLGIFNTFGRILSGWLSDRPWADCLLIHNCALIVAGLATCALPFIGNYGVIIGYCAIFGSCIAAYIALRSIVLVDLLGVQKLSNSFGILLLFQGIASIIGSPLSGALYDITGSYTVSFIVSGSFIAVAGVICLPIRRIAKWEKAKQQDFKEIKEIGSQYSKCPAEPENNV